MVHVYNCHPFASQHIVPTDQEPGLVCCGGDALFVVSAAGCKVEAYRMQGEDCPLICRFSTMGTVHRILYSQIGDYLVTIEEKNGSTYLRAYTNWRYQASERTRVGVRLLGHFLRVPSLCGAPKEQMEIIEMPLSEPPQCMACCALTGDLLVGCTRSLVVFGLKRQELGERLVVLDFEMLVVLHIHNWSPSDVALCAGYVALQTELEVLVVKLERMEKRHPPPEDCTPIPSPGAAAAGLNDEDMRQEPQSPHESDDFFMFPKHLELLGAESKDCGVSVTLEGTGAELGSSMALTYVLYRRFAPDFFRGCSVEETCLHSLQLHSMFPGNCEGGREPVCVFCFFSLPGAGYMYSLHNPVQLLSTYQYPEKTHEAALCDQFLYVITRNALQCFSVRCSAVAARAGDPYIDTTMKACPPATMEVCALRIQLFIGLRSLCHDGNHIVLITAVDSESKVETGSTTRRTICRKTSRSKQVCESGYGWNLYVITTVPTLQLYTEMVEYSRRYEQTLSHNSLHLLSEAHLLVRSSLLSLRGGEEGDRAQLQNAFRESCAQLGDCFSRLDRRDCHLALPYYKMSGLSVTEVIQRNVARSGDSTSVTDYGKGFLFFLKHSLYEETMEDLSEETANTVLDIFSQAEPAQLPHVVTSPFMVKADPACVLEHLEQLEVSGAPAVTLTLCKSAQALRLGNMQQYCQQMEQHSEMLQVFGFIEEPKLLFQGRGSSVTPTLFAQHLQHTQVGLLVAAMVALHENSKVKLEEADLFFQELCKDCVDRQSPYLLVDFWEALLVASSQDSIIQELLFRLASVYINRITRRDCTGITALKTAEDLINSCFHYGQPYPWVSILTHLSHCSVAPDNHQEDLHKLQSLLCGPTLDISSVLPLLEQLPDTDGAGVSVYVLCATRLGQLESSLERLLEHCPEAVIPYAHHQLHSHMLTLWWQKLFPELCKRARVPSEKGSVLLTALKETVKVVAMELSPLEFLELLPDDGSAHFFLPHLLECSLRHSQSHGQPHSQSHGS
ncbi:Hermansky-Pudlak syndrome 3 protein [Electrophorus electricus]|uniref:Hermansky-Pudlak syndrome 3 protein n=1 Tax=Electrophorus electricus TaxID=8005 RepID=UPI0015D0AA92|nr:Hermansky-Pudlak syndrome 3 protein [Electrophorus electricus]